MVIDNNLLVHPVRIVSFKHGVIELDGDIVPIKDPGHCTSKPNISKLDMRQVLMHNGEPYFYK